MVIKNILVGNVLSVGIYSVGDIVYYNVKVMVNG